jgi:hypothetical protein
MNNITKRVTKDFDFALIPVIRNLASLGIKESDIGMIIGYSGRDAKKFINDIKKNHPDVEHAFSIGAKIADTEIVTTAYEMATGYNFTEEVKEWVFEDELDDDGEPTGNRVKVLKKVRKYKKHQKPDSTILKMLLLSRFPDQFIDSKNSLISSPIDPANVTDEEIRRFAGALLQILPKKEIKSTEVIDAETT